MSCSRSEIGAYGSAYAVAPGIYVQGSKNDVFFDSQKICVCCVLMQGHPRREDEKGVPRVDTGQFVVCKLLGPLIHYGRA